MNAFLPPLSGDDSTKIRMGPAGIHFFSRASGMNLLVDDVIPPASMWALAPRQISLALTNACDLACAHCYAPKQRASLPFDKLKSWLHELDDNGTLGIGFGGGEPTLYRQFAELCSYTAQHTRLAVTFTTHGHHLSDSILSKLHGSINFARISLDGVGETYERIRGRSFSALTERLHSLAACFPFGINFVVNKATFPDIDSAIDLAESVGASEFLLLPEQPVNGSPGMDPRTGAELVQWVGRYNGSIPLAVSEASSAGFPTCDPLQQEPGLRAYAHIDAQGNLKSNSFQEHGVRIDQRGVIAAVRELTTHLPIA